MPDLRVRQLRYLVTVADEGGFTQAAQRLSMTQPALSRTIAALEREVGVDLLVRGNRGVELTVAGKILVERSRAILGQVESALRETRAAGADRSPVRVSAHGCEVAVLRGLVDSFNAAHPGAAAEPVVADHALDVVRSGGAGLALIRGPFDDDGMDSEVLESQERVAVLAGDHPLATRPSVLRAELAPDPVVTWPTTNAAEHAYWVGADGYPGKVLPGPEVRDMFHLFARVRAGEAIAFLPSRVQESFTVPPDVRTVAVRDLPPERLSLVWPAHETSVAVARFVSGAATAYAARAAAA